MDDITRPRPSNPYLHLFFVIALVIASGLGCGRIADMVRNRGGESPPPVPTPVSGGTPAVPGRTDSENSLVKKTNYYITDCFNRYSNRIIESHNRYSRWVKDLDAGPTGKETLVYGLYDVTGDGADCEKAVASAKALEPAMPEVEAAADNFVSALKSVIGEIRGVYNYYEQEDYKDDGFAKGKAAHPALMTAFKAFKDANSEFVGRVDQLEDEVAAKELERLTGEGKVFDALVMESGIKAKKIKNAIQDKEFEQISADELNTLIDDWSGTVEKIRADGSKPMANLYISACDDFTKSAKELMRRIRDGKKFTDTERRQISMGAGWMVDGSPAKLMKSYNDLLQRRRMARL
ncbi:MAG: YiiG family protein [Chloracidobacterium sp.]|nr:YiiG family protein [Chloracidobacterium sp.]